MTAIRAPSVEPPLRRIVVGYRVIALLWLGLLSAIQVNSDRIGLLTAAATVLVALAWTGLTVALGARHTGKPLRDWAFLAGDAVVGAWTVLAPALLEGSSVSVAAGYPFSVVVLGAWARGQTGALLVGGVLVAANALRLLVGGALTFVPVVENVLFYLLTGTALAWGLSVLRRSDADRRAAEDALADARSQRAVAEARAETAAHLHDSVLQTLALIQRRAGDPSEVATLARSQERDLRSWLDGGRLGGNESLAACLRAVAAEVERLHRVRVEVVSVGDRDMDPGLDALVAATREAVVNAAVHAGVDTVAVYAESDPRGSRVYIRDRGKGFDLGEIGPDRRGITESIRGRLERHGGSVRIDSRPGAGTEVELAASAASALPVGDPQHG